MGLREPCPALGFHLGLRSACPALLSLPEFPGTKLPTGSHSALGVLSSLRSLVKRSAAMSVSSLLFGPRMTSTHLPLNHLPQILCFGSQVSLLSVGLNKSPDVWLAHCSMISLTIRSLVAYVVEICASEKLCISTWQRSLGLLVNREGDNVSFSEAQGLLNHSVIGPQSVNRK